MTRLTKRRSQPRQGTGVYCSLCGWRGRRFLTHVGAGYIVWNAFCPACGSFPRHRGFAWLLTEHLAADLERLSSGNGKRLMFAPEPGMKLVLERYLTGLEGVDIDPSNGLVVYREDIQSLTFPDDSVQLLSCFHVIEHVPDDIRALAELSRVLQPDGIAEVNVPITFGRWETIEFGYPTPLLNDHHFDYEEEFSIRVTQAGFSGTGYRLSEVVPPEQFEQMALQDELIYWLKPTYGEPLLVDQAEKFLTVRPSE